MKLLKLCLMLIIIADPQPIRVDVMSMKLLGVAHRGYWGLEAKLAAPIARGRALCGA